MSATKLAATIEIIRNEWKLWGVKYALVSKEEVFYSGQAYAEEGNADELLYAKRDLWMSQSAFWAAEYCYFGWPQIPGSPSFRYLYKLRFKEDAVLVRFPPNLHPADAFKVNPSAKERFEWRRDMTAMNMQPDHFISRYWSDIIEEEWPSCTGHERRSRRDAPTDLGAVPGEILEAWTNEPKSLEVAEVAAMPSSKDEHTEKHCIDKSKVAVSVFG